MGNISPADARGLYTKTLVAVYKQRPVATSFLRSFFPSKETGSKEVSIEVQRGTEKIAVDVLRGTEGNRNSFSRSTEKIFVPPYYREYFDLTELDLYDRMFGVEDISASVFADFINGVADKLMELQKKIERAYEKQCADVLETGVITLADGTDIDFKRKASSKVTLTGTDLFTDAASNPYDTFEDMALFLRTEGLMQGGSINLIFGRTALAAFLDNAKVKARADIRNFRLDDVAAPQRNATGAALHGQFTAGAWTFNIWSYPQYYKNAAGSTVPYINDKKVVALPESPEFNLVFAAVPQLPSINGGVVKKGAFIFGEYVDEKNTVHIQDVKSAGVALPVAVDQIVTYQVVA
jgi:hypothetical protein